jgi:catechol 2,3-dioxygenase-like lactoylglutathione lyase family enzyme
MPRISVRYIIDDVPAATRFYTTFLGFSLEQDASPAFASVTRDGVRLLLSGDGSSGIILDDPSGNPVELFQPRR